MASKKKERKKAEKEAANQAAEKPFFYRDKTKKALWAILIGACLLSLVVGFVTKRHGHFSYEKLGILEYIFPALLGLVSCIAMVLLAKLMGIFLKVKGDFYDDE